MKLISRTALTLFMFLFPAGLAAACGAGNASFRILPPIEDEGGCGAPDPVALIALGAQAGMKVNPEAIVNCSMTAVLARWEAEVVQPAAREHFGQNVNAIRQWASYVCRTRNGKKGAKLSEHALANAIDVAIFTLEDRRKIAVKEDWGQDNPQGRFLRQVHDRSCALFGTVLGPEADIHHQDHFHLDLGNGGICQ